jgi:hypothetical protein
MTVKTHTDLSPSNASRWMNCPGSVALCKTVPKPPQSAYASEGEAAHELLERCLKDPKVNPFDFVGGTAANGYEWNEEMADAVSFSLTIIRGELQKGGELLTEQKVDVIPGLIGGTLDAAVIREMDTIVVYDFKYGKGVLVSAVDNQQLLMYLMPLVKKYDALKMKLVILQPRTENQVSMWECNQEYLDTFIAEVSRKIALAQEKDALISSGDWCKFCAAKIVCPAFRTDMNTALALPGSAIIFPDVKGLSPKTVKNVLDYKDRIEDWMDAVAGYAQEFIEAGGAIEGYELGKKRANRKWINEEEALKVLADLGEKAFVVKILSPAQMEKVAGKDRVAPLVETPDNGMTLKKIGEKK